MNNPHIWDNYKEASANVSRWKELGHTVVFTNGCFDIFHEGHLNYLKQASKLGDKLIIGLNNDVSVKRLKGNNRPIHPEGFRSSLLAHLSFVDAVVLFGESTPQKIIDLLVPDILVKGGDYTLDEVVGRETVLSHGGEVLLLPYVDDISTTEIIKKIQSI